MPKSTPLVLNKPPKPASLRFRRDGRLDFRPRNQRSWIKGLTEINTPQFLSLPHRIRRRVVLVEFVLGRSLVTGTPVVVSRS